MTSEAVTEERIRQDLLRSLSGAGGGYLAAAAFCLLIVAAGAAAWAIQIDRGMVVTGLTRPVYWGFYIVNFVFWIGISHAGTLISAILRLTDAGWRKPVTRAAEAITLFALMIGGMFPLIHLGRVGLFYWLLPYPNDRMLWPNFRSPLVWDMTAILTYLIGSFFYLYLPLIPDLALLAKRTTGMRSKICGLLALGWSGADYQWNALEKATKLMAAIILAIAISVHSVVAFDFSMTLAPMWHSTIFGPYFVTGAIFSGIGALVIVMAAIRKFLRLENYLRPVHFDNLGKLLLLMSIVWLYFTASEHLTVWYGNNPIEMNVFQAREHGGFGFASLMMLICNFVIPFILLGVKRLRTIPTIVFSGFSVLVGMWLERFLIVLPTLSNPPLRAAAGAYWPSPVELTITAATFAAMVLLYLLFAKAVPIIAIWEYEHEADG